MNIDIELSIKLKVKEDPRDAGADKRRTFAILLEKIAAHPCVAIILRELVRHS